MAENYRSQDLKEYCKVCLISRYAISDAHITDKLYCDVQNDYVNPFCICNKFKGDVSI